MDTKLNATKTAAASAPSGAALKKNALNIWEIAFFALAASGPVFVVSGVAWTTYAIGGIGAAMGYIVSGVLLMFFVVGFAAMGKYIGNAGAFYAYITAGLGRLIGVGSAMVAIFAYSLMSIGFYGAFAYFAQSTFADVFNIHISWQVWAVFGVLWVAFFGYRNVSLGAWVVGILLIAEVVILAALSVAVIIRNPGGMSVVPFKPSSFFVPGVSALLVFGYGAYTGFETTAIYAEETLAPERTIPRATYIVVGFLTVFYGITVWIASVAFGVGGVMRMALSPNASDIYFTASQDYLGHWAFIAMRVLVVTSIMACTMAWHNAVARYGFSLGRERLLPKVLGLSHGKMGSPYVASLVQSGLALLVVIVCIVFAADPYLKLFVWTYSIGVVGMVTCYCLTSVSVIGYFWKDRRGNHVLQVLIIPVIGAIGLGFSLYLILANFNLLSGYTGAVNLAFILPVPVVLLAGVIFASWIKSSDPHRYASLGADMINTNVCALDEIEECEPGT